MIKNFFLLNMVKPETPQMTIRRMRFACWITKATHTHANMYCSLVFHGNNGFANVPQCYVTRTLPLVIAQMDCLLRGTESK